MLRKLVLNSRYATKIQQQSATVAITFRRSTSGSSKSEESATHADRALTPPGGHLELYTAEQNDRILGIVNNKDLQELLSYDISKARAGKLLAWQGRHGPLQQVQDILQVEGFGQKVVEKLCRSLLEGPKVQMAAAKTTRARTAPFITPLLGIEQQQCIRSCVSVRIGVSSVTWARLEVSAENSPCLLTDWQHHAITERKLHLNDLVQRCLYVDHLIPHADCYLFESPQTAAASNNPGNAEQQNINIQKAQITAVLSFALSARGRQHGEREQHNDDAPEESQLRQSQPNVFYLRRFLSARLFSHLVGTERVSSEQTILNLMRTYYNTDEQQDYVLEEEAEAATEASDNTGLEERLSFRGNVQFPADLREEFARAERFHREFLGQALLLSLAFVRLVVLQDPQSIALVSRGSNKGKAAETPDK